MPKELLAKLAALDPFVLGLAAGVVVVILVVVIRRMQSAPPKSVAAGAEALALAPAAPSPPPAAPATAGAATEPADPMVVPAGVIRVKVRAPGELDTPRPDGVSETRRRTGERAIEKPAERAPSRPAEKPPPAERSTSGERPSEAHAEQKRSEPRVTGGYMPRPASHGGGAVGGHSGHFDTRRPGEEDFDRWKDKKEKRIVSELEDQNVALANAISMLPGFIRRLAETTKKREVAPLLADMVERFCTPPPERVMVFFLSKSKTDLVLAARVGFGDAPGDASAPQVKIPKTLGRLGYALKAQFTMDAKDFEREQIDDVSPPGERWTIEVAAPIVSGKEPFGIIAASGFPFYSKNPKRLIGVTADVGALIISLAETKAQIQHQANSDALTGCYNKRYFFERLEFEIERTREQGKPLSLFMFDIDHFKKFNDRNGHQAGDEALKITGQLLNERKRDGDIAARYGGEEFIVILPGTNKDGAYNFGESLRKMIADHPYPHGEGQPLGKVSISGGVSTYPEDGTAPTTLIEVADACLYKSKEHGRNHVTRMSARDVLA